MSLEQLHNPQDEKDPDGIGDFLAEYDLNWNAINKMNMREVVGDEQLSLVTDTTVKAVANATAATFTSPSRESDYSKDNEIPVIAGDAVYEALKTAEIPPIYRLNGIEPHEQEALENPLLTDFAVSSARRSIRNIIARNLGELNLDDDGAFYAQLAISEVLTNAVRHGGGVRRVIIGRTPYNNLFFGAENLAIDNIEDFQIHPSPQQARSIGNTAALGLGIEHDEELTADMHNRGLFLLASCSVNGVQTDAYSGLKKGRTLSAGMSPLPIDMLAKLANFEEITDNDLDPTGQPLRTLAWGAFGLDSEEARRADALERQSNRLY